MNNRYCFSSPMRLTWYI